MPKDADPLSTEQIAIIREWISKGAKWPAGLKLEAARINDTIWWSLKPVVRPQLPKLTDEQSKWIRTPIDAFVLSKLTRRFNSVVSIRIVSDPNC